MSGLETRFAFLTHGPLVDVDPSPRSGPQFKATLAALEADLEDLEESVKYGLRRSHREHGGVLTHLNCKGSRVDRSSFVQSR